MGRFCYGNKIKVALIQVGGDIGNIKKRKIIKKRGGQHNTLFKHMGRTKREGEKGSRLEVLDDPRKGEVLP